VSGLLSTANSVIDDFLLIIPDEEEICEAVSTFLSGPCWWQVPTELESPDNIMVIP